MSNPFELQIYEGWCKRTAKEVFQIDSHLGGIALNLDICTNDCVEAVHQYLIGYLFCHGWKPEEPIGRDYKCSKWVLRLKGADPLALEAKPQDDGLRVQCHLPGDPGRYISMDMVYVG
ncbi:hypothetical protein KOR42_23300 [Thalassoglobus neptunius]|uniref:Uncharacterized protein n=1 Tax=Thalassoglobus neptunius TaxID=1938619 RepID=A0A5C5X9F5_9PLAN|nr:hypothetical protein [Thalassoglobus neptunius]TWT58943.1 hypothetical protein KOR42_23300 [Thalassoglobus neptunius]